MKLNKLNLKENPYKKFDELNKQIDDLTNKNKKLTEEKKDNEVTVSLLKSQLENMDKLNKEYEGIIENLKLELEREREKSKINSDDNMSNFNKKNIETESTDDEK